MLCFLQSRGGRAIVSTMTAEWVDAESHATISGLTLRVLGGEEISRQEARWLFDLENGADIFDLMAGANRIRQLAAGGKTRPDASLGIIKSQRVADRLKEAGLECYGHNLESSKRFFPAHCTTHTYEDRLETISHLKNAGIKICSGGIIGMGETREDRCELAFALKEAGANVVPINILNPIKGTPFEQNPPLPPLEILKTIACFRFILPRQEIMIAGGRTVNLRDLQSLIFAAGASALMVGNYLTTLNQPVEKDLQMLQDLGLDPNWDKHDFSDQEETGCGCATESRETEPAVI